MCSVEQSYIELFKENRETIERNVSSVLNSCRDRALERLQQYGLPSKQLEEYLHTDVSDFFRPDWGMNIGRLPIKTDYTEAFRCNVPNLTTLLFYLAGDRFVAGESANRVSLPEGAIIESLNSAAISYPELVMRYYGGLAKLDSASVAHINTLFTQDGLFIYIPKGVVLDRPIQLVSLMQSPVEMMVNRRLLVVLEQGASAKLLLCDHSIESRASLSTMVIECFVGEGATCSIYDMEETHSQNSRVSDIYIEQQADSSVEFKNVTLHNGRSRNSVYVTLSGTGASLNIDGIAIADKQQHIDNYTYIAHNASNCSSSELYKYVADDTAVGVFSGKVYVAEGAQQSLSNQTNRNILLTKSAKVYTQPQLEIYADDVKCSHGATVGQLDEHAMFYMQQRGITAAEAKTLLMLAFVDEVIGGIKLVPLRDRLRHLIEKRFRGDFAQCEGCNICR